MYFSMQYGNHQMVNDFISVLERIFLILASFYNCSIFQCYFHMDFNQATFLTTAQGELPITKNRFNIISYHNFL